MSVNLQQLLKVQHAAQILRNMAEQYLISSSNMQRTQGEIMMEISDLLAASKLASAAAKYDHLHQKIKLTLPFEVIDVISKGEQMIENHLKNKV